MKKDSEDDAKKNDAKENAEKEIKQRKYIEFQLLAQQREQLQSQLQAFDSQILELEGIKESLREISQLKEGTEIYVSVAGGIFVNASVKNAKEFLVNVGSNAIAAKDAQSAIQILDRQSKEVVGARASLVEQLTVNAIHLKALQNELLKLLNK